MYLLLCSDILLPVERDFFWAASLTATPFPFWFVLTVEHILKLLRSWNKIYLIWFVLNMSTLSLPVEREIELLPMSMLYNCKRSVAAKCYEFYIKNICIFTPSWWTWQRIFVSWYNHKLYTSQSKSRDFSYCK